jgi:hypothetical protein
MAEVFAVQSMFEDSSGWIMARVVGMANTNITQASISKITLRVYAKDNWPETDAINDPAVVAERTLVKDDVVFDALQTDSGWDLTKDADGFNFKMEVLSTDIPKGSQKYRFELRFADTNTPTPRTWPVVVEVPTEGLYTS